MTKRLVFPDRLRRREILALGGAGLLASLLPQHAFAKATADVSVQLNWLETGDFAPLFAAELKGFDTAAGVRQMFVPGGPQMDPIQSVAGGSAMVGIGATIGQAALARANGIPVKVFAAFNRQSPAGLISLAKNPIRTPQDAIGKRIGLQGGARLVWSIIMAENGLTEDQMTIVPVAGDVTPLVSEQVDGFWGTAINQHLSLKLQGIDNNIMPRGEAGAPEHFGVLFALEDSIRDNAHLIVQWLRGTIEGARFAKENPAEVAAHIVARSPDLQLKLEQQQQMLEASRAFEPASSAELRLLQIDEAAARTAIEQLGKAQQLPTAVSLEDLMVPELLDRAYA